MAKDFRAGQVRTTQIIGSGSQAGKPSILVVSASDSAGFNGEAMDSSTLLANVGSDVFLFVTGSSSRLFDHKREHVTLFGGDVVISGTMYAEHMVAEVDQVSTGSLMVSGSLIVSQSATVFEGLVINESGEGGAENDFRVESAGEDEALFIDAGTNALYINKGETAFETHIASTNDVAVSVTAAGVVLNEDGHATNDFRVESTGEDEAIFLDAGANALHINKGETAFETHVASTNDVALSVTAAGVVLNEDGHATNDFRVESSNNTHALFVDSGGDQVLIGAKAAPTIGADAGVFISGTIGGIGKTSGDAAKGTTVIGGDAVISGTLGMTSLSSAGADGVFAVTASLLDVGYDPNNPSVDNTPVEIRITGYDPTIFSNEEVGKLSFFGNEVGAQGLGEFANISASPNGGYGSAGQPDGKLYFDTSVGGVSYKRAVARGQASDSRFEVLNPADENDKLSIKVEADGVTTISTTDSASTNANLTISSDGRLALDSTINQVMILSGGVDSTGRSEATYADTSFFVSGAIASRGGAGKGTAVFGGDVVLSGTLIAIANGVNGASISGSIHETSDGLSYLVAGTNMAITSASNGQVTIGTTGVPDGSGAATRIAYWADADTLTSNSTLTFDGSTLTTPAVLVNDGLTVNANVAITGDTVAETTLNIRGTGAQEGAFLNVEDSSGDDKFTIVTEDQTFARGTDVNVFASGSIGSKDTAVKGTTLLGGDLVVSGNVYLALSESLSSENTLAHAGHDVNFFVSGAAGSRGTDIHGTSVFGGDMVVSGGMVVGREPGESSDGSLQDFVVNSKDSAGIITVSGQHNYVQFQASDSSGQLSLGQDTFFHVSGTIGGKGHGGVAAFGGDLFVSGNAYLVPGTDGNALSSVGTNVHIFLSGNNGVDSQSQYAGLGSGGAILLGGDTILSGGLVVGPGDGHNTASWQVEFGQTDNWGSDVNFVVSGNIGHMGDPWPESYVEGQPHGATTLIGGDLVVSGALKVGGGRGADDKKNWPGGTISGSIHETEHGLSYLVAGPNVTIASGTNGQISISATGGVEASGTPTDNQIAIWTDADTLEGTSTLTYDGTTISLNDAVTINEAGGNNDFRVATQGEDEALFIDADTNILYINKGETDFTTVIGSDNDEAIRVDDHGIVFNEDGHASNDLRIESNNKQHAFFLDAGTEQVFILSGSAVANPNMTPPESAYSDLAFFVSGAVGSKGTTVKGASLFGGDVVVSGSILPGIDNSVNLGGTQNRWANIYTGDLHLKNERGDWTVIEEEEYLTLRNNKNGRMFKLLMEEITE